MNNVWCNHVQKDNLQKALFLVTCVFLSKSQNSKIIANGNTKPNLRVQIMSLLLQIVTN